MEFKDCDGISILNGERIYCKYTGTEYRYNGEYEISKFGYNVMKVTTAEGIDTYRLPESLTHVRPLVAADGLAINRGDHLWHIKTRRGHYVVTHVDCFGMILDGIDDWPYNPKEFKHIDL